MLIFKTFLSIFRIIDLFDPSRIIQTLILALGILSIINIALNIYFGTFNALEQNTEVEDLLPQGRMLEIMNQVFHAIDVMDQKY